MDFQPTEEQQAIHRMVRDFAEKEIAPRAEEIDETDRFPEDLFRGEGLSESQRLFLARHVLGR